MAVKLTPEAPTPFASPEGWFAPHRRQVKALGASSRSERAACSPRREPRVSDLKSRPSPRMRVTDLMVQIFRSHTRAPNFHSDFPRLTPGALRCRSLRGLSPRALTWSLCGLPPPTATSCAFRTCECCCRRRLALKLRPQVALPHLRMLLS